MKTKNFYIVSIIIIAFLGGAIATFFFSKRNSLKVSSKETSSLRLTAFNSSGIYKEWSARIDRIGAARAYEEFKEAYLVQDSKFQHLAAHVMGSLLYEKKGLAGLGVCDATFAFGCYHSFFGSAVSKEGIGAIKDFDRTCMEKFGPWGTGCPHGIGHGILEYMGHEKLYEALDACSYTMQKHPLLGCTSGVFMEYNFPILIGSGEVSSSLREWNPEASLSPCISVAEKYRSSCFFEIAQWWERVLYQDYAKMGKLCQTVNSQNEREVCFLGIGHALAPTASYNIQGAIARCNQMPDAETKIFCRAGASWGFFVVPEQRANAPLLCENLSPAVEKECLNKAQFIK